MRFTCFHSYVKIVSDVRRLLTSTRNYTRYLTIYLSVHFTKSFSVNPRQQRSNKWLVNDGPKIIWELRIFLQNKFKYKTFWSINWQIKTQIGQRYDSSNNDRLRITAFNSPLIKEALSAYRFSNENFIAQDNVTPSQCMNNISAATMNTFERKLVEWKLRQWKLVSMRDSRHARLVHVIELSNANAVNARYCISRWLRRYLEYIPNAPLVNACLTNNSNRVNWTLIELHMSKKKKDICKIIGFHIFLFRCKNFINYRIDSLNLFRTTEAPNNIARDV